MQAVAVAAAVVTEVVVLVPLLALLLLLLLSDLCLRLSLLLLLLTSYRLTGFYQIESRLMMNGYIHARFHWYLLLSAVGFELPASRKPR